MFKDRDCTTSWDNLILNYHHSKTFFPLCPIRISLVTFLLPDSFNSGFSSAPSLHHICPVLLLAQVVCQKHRLCFKKSPCFLFGAIGMHSSISHWPFGSLIVFLFPSLRTVKFISVHVFSKWIYSYMRTSYDVPDMSMHLVILHSNVVQPMLVVALICFYIPDICFEDFYSNPYQLVGKVQVTPDSQEE